MGKKHLRKQTLRTGRRGKDTLKGFQIQGGGMGERGKNKLHSLKKRKLGNQKTYRRLPQRGIIEPIV